MPNPSIPAGITVLEYAVLVVWVALVVISLVTILGARDSNPRFGSIAGSGTRVPVHMSPLTRVAWVLVVLLLPVLGSVVWLTCYTITRSSGSPKKV